MRQCKLNPSSASCRISICSFETRCSRRWTSIDPRPTKSISSLHQCLRKLDPKQELQDHLPAWHHGTREPRMSVPVRDAFHSLTWALRHTIMRRHNGSQSTEFGATSTNSHLSTTSPIVIPLPSANSILSSLPELYQNSHNDPPEPRV